ncbi:hypothetical protein FSP39_020868 [Pinctada imbricata]|uniref:Multiple inositol polyphosphate phosphatase 1 n=1 Tax=Pinctada imbricata TaxID=66713 RepID=A0AA88Y688_PINIB|nr:hypothetical protein FSP39_020868 [Pinctada imbricata]
MFGFTAITLSTICVCGNADILTGYGNNLFASKTGYFWTHPAKQFILNQFNDLHYNNSTCKAIQLNFISRHAARYTGADDMDSFTLLQNKIKSSYKNTNYSFIQSWVNDYPTTKESSVTKLGIEEMNYLGEKFGYALLDLLRSKLNTVKLRCSHSQRTNTSAQAFFKGLSKAVNNSNVLHVLPAVDDRVTHFYKGCSNYESKVEYNKTYMHEMYDFQKTPTFMNMVNGIADRLGMLHILTADDAKMMYLLCATEVAIRNRSEWCTLQTDSDREILEYENDLEDYYLRLYGHPVTAAMTCPLVQDVFRSLDHALYRSKSNQTYPVVDARFGHSPTIGALLAALGLFKDVHPLTAKNYQTMKHRLFFDSSVIPFSANVAFILYECGHGTPKTNFLKLYVNEEPVVIPACNSVTCEYSVVRRYYSDMVDKCDWNNVCKSVHFSPSNIVG